jgi:putative colanic acid biosynthesis acetyltransferase WcaF
LLKWLILANVVPKAQCWVITAILDMIDVASNRAAKKYSKATTFRRVVWAAVYPLFRLSPRICYGWRNLLLRVMGARVGTGARVDNRADITFPWNVEIGPMSSVAANVLIYSLGQVSIGHSVTISHNAQLCAGTHDYRRNDFPLLLVPIVVKDGAWICANAFICPGVTVGESAIVGACAVATKNIPDRLIVAGNPARQIGTREANQEESDASARERV